VRLQDLRHTHASFLFNAARTLYEVQHILGYTQVSTTQRYAHLSPDTLLKAANSVHKTLGGMFAARANVKALTMEPLQVV